MDVGEVTLILLVGLGNDALLRDEVVIDELVGSFSEVKGLIELGLGLLVGPVLGDSNIVHGGHSFLLDDVVGFGCK
jgi:hypothetical protein